MTDPPSQATPSPAPPDSPPAPSRPPPTTPSPEPPSSSDEDWLYSEGEEPIVQHGSVEQSLPRSHGGGGDHTNTGGTPPPSDASASRGDGRPWDAYRNQRHHDPHHAPPTPPWTTATATRLYHDDDDDDDDDDEDDENHVHANHSTTPLYAPVPRRQGRHHPVTRGAKPTVPGGELDMARRDRVRLETKFHDAGYREGITQGKLSTLQAGFDQGFNAVGAGLGRRVGRLRGEAAALLAYLVQSTSGGSIGVGGGGGGSGAKRDGGEVDDDEGGHRGQGERGAGAADTGVGIASVNAKGRGKRMVPRGGLASRTGYRGDAAAAAGVEAKVDHAGVGALRGTTTTTPDDATSSVAAAAGAAAIMSVDVQVSPRVGGSTASTSAPTANVAPTAPPPTKAPLLAEARSLVSELARVTLDEVAPVDYEAVEHEREHDRSSGGGGGGVATAARRRTEGTDADALEHGAREGNGAVVKADGAGDEDDEWGPRRHEADGGRDEEARRRRLEAEAKERRLSQLEARLVALRRSVLDSVAPSSSSSPSSPSRPSSTTATINNNTSSSSRVLQPNTAAVNHVPLPSRHAVAPQPRSALAAATGDATIGLGVSMSSTTPTTVTPAAAAAASPSPSPSARRPNPSSNPTSTSAPPDSRPTEPTTTTTAAPTVAATATATVG